MAPLRIVQRRLCGQFTRRTRRNTKDTKEKRDGGVHTHKSLLFFVSFVSFVASAERRRSFGQSPAHRLTAFG